MDRLTIKEERFVSEYLIDGNATRAHRAAGYYSRSEDGRRTLAGELLAKPHIQASVAKGQHALIARSEKNQDDVRNEFIAIGFSNIFDYMEYTSDKGVVFYSLKDIPKEKLRAIKRFREVEIEYRDKNGNVTSVKRQREIVLHDKVRALEGLALQFGMNNGVPPKLSFWQQLINVDPKTLTDEQLLMIRQGQIPAEIVNQLKGD